LRRRGDTPQPSRGNVLLDTMHPTWRTSRKEKTVGGLLRVGGEEGIMRA